MSFNSKDNQTDKKALLAKNKIIQVNQSSKTKTSSDKVRRDKKKKSYQRQYKKLGRNPTTTIRANAQVIKDQKKKQLKNINKNTFQITY